MNVSTNKDELKSYLEIIDFFQNHQVDDESVEIWKSKSLIELMKVLHRTKNKKFARNVIILMISLFDHLPPDTYNNHGIDAKLLNKKDKASFISQMKLEFDNGIPN